MNKKSGKITPLILSDEVRTELELSKIERGTSFVQSVEDSVMGKDRFNSRIEAGIRGYQSENKCSRTDAIEGMLIDAMIFRNLKPNSKETPANRRKRMDEFANAEGDRILRDKTFQSP